MAATTRSLPPGRGFRFVTLSFLVLAVQFAFLLFSFQKVECSSQFNEDLRTSLNGGPGLTPRRLLVGWTIRKFFLLKTPDTLLGERSRSLRSMAPGCDYGLQFLYSAILVAGKHTGAQSSLIDTSMEDILVAFFRLADLKSTRFPLQWYAVENALKRSHRHAIDAASRRLHAENQDHEDDPDRVKPLELTVPEYTWMLGQQLRDLEWFFDGNTFHKRGPVSIPDKLTDRDLGFMKSLPFNVLRVARGIQREEPTKNVAHLIDELSQRGVTTSSDFFLKTNFLDLMFSTNVIDEVFLQLDILSEYISNWESFKEGKVVPPTIPLGNGQPKLLETLMSKKTTREEYPKCPTMRCYVKSVWSERSEHPLDKEEKQNEQGEKKKAPANETFIELQIKKKTSNSLKIVAIGNTGHETYSKSTGFGGGVKKVFRTNEFESTVEAMRQWHEKEHVDIALGLGDFLESPGTISVRDPAFKNKFHDVFVRAAGLDIPWYMVNGEQEAMVGSSVPFRYHYSRQDMNYHNPNWLHKAVVTMVANLTTAEGGSEDQEFTVHILSVDTWTLFGGPPFYDNIGQYQNNMAALSRALFHSAKAKADWIIVQGHHPLLSTAPEAEEARLSFIGDLVKNGRPRGPEHRLVELLTAHQVDAYISGHDHAMEYVTMSDLETNSTLAFVTSGGGTRIMDKTIGRGWLGTIRGKLFPVLCWASKRIFYKLDPGGCKPSEKDQALAYKFYAPSGSNWKISVKERILHTTGFASLKLTKDFLIVDFINGRDGKPTGRKLHKQTNREARAVKFIDLWEDADLKLKELNIDHEAFEEENRERVASEIAFQTRTPILAERLRLYEKELVDMYNEYQQLKNKKASYETMNAQKVAMLEAHGENFRESELSEGMYEQTERIIELMYIIVADHTYMWKRYEALKQLRKGLPASDSKYAEEILKLEKKFAEVKKMRRDVHKRYVEQGIPPTNADAEQIKEHVMNARVLKRDIAELEETMAKEGKEDKKKDAEGEKPKEETPPIRPLDMSVEARLARKKQQLEEHENVMERIKGLSISEKKKLKEEIGMLQRQREKLVAEVEKLDNLLNRKEWAADRRPSELWEKRMQLNDLEQTLKQLEAYKASIIDLPKAHRRTNDLSDAVTNIELQKLEIEEQMLEVKDELYKTEPTELQKKFGERMEKLREFSMLVESKSTMPPELLEDPEIKKSLEAAEEMLVKLQVEVEALDEAVRKELNIQDEAWVKRMIIRGADMRELAEEFSIDINTVREEDAEARRKDPKRQLGWLNQQEWAAQQRLARIEKVPPEQADKVQKDKELVLARLEELGRLKKEAEEALAALELMPQEAEGGTNTTEAEGEESEKKAAGTEKDKEEEGTVKTTENLSEVSSDPSKGQEEVSTDTLESPPLTPPAQEAVQGANFVDSELDDWELEEGSERRRLAAIMEWFQPKKEESPVKELPKIDLGPKDPCESEPMLYVVVKKSINAEYGANFAERCKRVFAVRSHRSQRKFIALFDDSGSSAFYESPHYYVVKGLRELFGVSKVNSFISLLKTMKDRLLEISSKIEVATFEQVSKAEEVSQVQVKDGKEFEVTDDETVEFKDD